MVIFLIFLHGFIEYYQGLRFLYWVIQSIHAACIFRTCPYQSWLISRLCTSASIFMEFSSDKKSWKTTIANRDRNKQILFVNRPLKWERIWKITWTSYTRLQGKASFKFPKPRLWLRTDPNLQDFRVCYSANAFYVAQYLSYRTTWPIYPG